MRDRPAGPRRPPTWWRIPVMVLVIVLVAVGAVARVNAQQRDHASPRLLASRTADRADPVPLDTLGNIGADEPLYVFLDATNDEVDWAAFYLDLTTPDGLTRPRIEHHAPFDLAGTAEDGQATPLDPGELGDDPHRITAIVGLHTGDQTLVTGTFQIGGIGTPSPTPTPTTPPTTNKEPEPPTPAAQEFGVHQDLHFGVRDGAIDAARQLGVTVSRSSFLWDKIQPEPGQVDWSSTDRFINQLTDAGLEPLLYFVGSPSWINGSDDRYVVPTDDAAFERWVAEYAEFAQGAAERYRGTVTRWEIGNEPNQDDFWKPTPDPARYRQWYLAMRQAILEGNPDADVAIGGLTGLTASCCIRGLDFLHRLIELDTPIDAVSIHPYPGQGQAPDQTIDGENDFTDIRLVHQLLTTTGLADAALWVTEWGWSSQALGEQTQATYVATSIRMLRQDFPYVELATYFLDYDRPQFSHGLLRADLSPKPAAKAFTTAIQP